MENVWVRVPHAGSGLSLTMTEEMFGAVTRQVIGTDQITFGDHPISLKAPFARLSLREAAREAAGRKLGRDVSDSELRDRDTVAGLARQLGLEVQPGSGSGKISS